MPQSDWVLIGSDDLDELIGNCESCGTGLRYIFAICHDKWGALAVGTDCCDRLTMSTEASEYHDKYVKAREAKGRFLASKRWQWHGLEWLIKRQGIAISIASSNGKFRITMNGAKGKTDYATLVDAKLKAFDLIESGEAAKYLAKRRHKI